MQKTFSVKTQRHSAAEPQPNRQATRFNAEVAEGFAKDRRGRVFSAELRANLCVLCVKEIFAERDEVGRYQCKGAKVLESLSGRLGGHRLVSASCQAVASRISIGQLCALAVLSPNFVAFCKDFRRSMSREGREESEVKKARDRSFAPFAAFARPLGCGFAALCLCIEFRLNSYG